MKKVIFYGTFMALGIFWAEVVSTNAPPALIHPSLYLAYGLLYVLFIDGLLRRDVRDFHVWYLYGALVGLITETYVAKVTFYGTAPGSYRLWGVAPGAIAFIILFYHAFYSFLGPVWLARMALGMPFPVPFPKWIRVLLLSPPLISGLVFIATGVPAGVLLWQTGGSVGVLILWVMVLKAQGDIGNILLSEKTRWVVTFFTVLLYVVFLFTATNTRAHGHAPTDFPVTAMIAVSVVIGAVVMLCRRAGRGASASRAVAAYSPRWIRWDLWLGWILWYIAGEAMLLVLLPVIRPWVNAVFSIFIAGGAVAGVGTFFVSICFSLFPLRSGCARQDHDRKENFL